MQRDSLSFHAYEVMAEYYYTHVDEKPHNAYYERPAMVSLLPTVKGKRVLDVACAAGWYSKWLIDQEAQVTAMDFSPAMIAMTRRRVGDRATLIEADLNGGLSFLKDQFFDVILSSLTLHYIRDWYPVMEDFYRILKRGGYLVFSVHHPLMDYLLLNREDYFSIELIEDTWRTPQGEIEVEFYRRPLREIFSPLFVSGFIVEVLHEPMPTDDFKEAMQKEYEKLLKKPMFLFARAKKI